MYKIVNYLQETGTMGTAAEHVGDLNINTYYGITGVIFHSMSEVTSSNNFIYPSNSHEITLDESTFNINLPYSLAKVKNTVNGILTDDKNTKDEMVKKKMKMTKWDNLRSNKYGL